MKSPIAHTLSILLGLFFLIAGALKLWGHRAFNHHISDFGLAPEFLVPTVAMVIPLCEIAGGIGLLRRDRWAVLGMAGLLTLFQFVLAYGLWIELDVDCGCLGIEEHLPFEMTLGLAFARNFIFLAICAYIYPWKGEETDAPPHVDSPGDGLSRDGMWPK